MNRKSIPVVKIINTMKTNPEEVAEAAEEVELAAQEVVEAA